MNLQKTAILIDFAFYIRFRATHSDPVFVADDMIQYCEAILATVNRTSADLMRIMVYDCEPAQKKVHAPISNKMIDFSKSDTYHFRTQLHQRIVKLRKVALRLGRLNDGGKWQLKSAVLKDLLKGKMQLADLTDDHFEYDFKQKGVDMRLGLDLATLAAKKLVDQVIIVARDADFMPALKLARREGLDVLLDSLGQSISNDMYRQIDGLIVLKQTLDD